MATAVLSAAPSWLKTLPPQQLNVDFNVLGTSSSFRASLIPSPNLGIGGNVQVGIYGDSNIRQKDLSLVNTMQLGYIADKNQPPDATAGDLFFHHCIPDAGAKLVRSVDYTGGPMGYTFDQLQALLKIDTPGNRELKTMWDVLKLYAPAGAHLAASADAKHVALERKGVRTFTFQGRCDHFTNYADKKGLIAGKRIYIVFVKTPFEDKAGKKLAHTYMSMHCVAGDRWPPCAHLQIGIVRGIATPYSTKRKSAVDISLKIHQENSTVQATESDIPTKDQ